MPHHESQPSDTVRASIRGSRAKPAGLQPSSEPIRKQPHAPARACAAVPAHARTPTVMSATVPTMSSQIEVNTPRVTLIPQIRAAVTAISSAYPFKSVPYCGNAYSHEALRDGGLPAATPPAVRRSAPSSLHRTKGCEPLHPPIGAAQCAAQKRRCGVGGRQRTLRLLATDANTPQRRLETNTRRR